MLRLALCGLTKAHQGGCWHIYTAAAALPAQHCNRAQQPVLLAAASQDVAGHNWPACQLQHQVWYSQAAQSAADQQQEQQQKPKQQQDLASADAGANATRSSATARSQGASSSGNGSSKGASSESSSSSGGGNGSKRGPDVPPAGAVSRSNSVGRKAYMGAITAADHHRRGTAAAVQQLDPVPAKQQHVAQQQVKQEQPQPREVLQAQQPLGVLQEQQPLAASNKQLREQLREQQWEVEYKHHRSQQPQHQVQQPQAGPHKQQQQQSQPSQPHSYKIVQYSRGNSLMLSLSTEPSGEYSLSKTKGPASAADLAAFGRTKPTKDGAAAAAKAAKEVPLLLRPFQQYLQRLKKVLQATFLPSGYPASVGSNYLEYTLWQAVTNFATTANGVLASTFLLYSVGLGAGAIPTAGALNWVLKDGLGQMGTLLFGKAIAHNFDIHSKTWYFMSFLLLSTATGLEIATILVPQAFLVLGSCANMIKGLSWMAGGSTRSVFNLSFVRDNNIADITAKNTSQYIFASLFGTAAGVSCCAYIGQSAPLALLCFSGLAYTSMYSAYRTVKAIPLPTLNSSRLQLLAARYLKCVRTTASDGFPGVLSYERQHGFMSYQQEYEVPEDEDDTCELELPSPLDMAEMDNPLPWVVGDPRLMNPGIHVGSQLDRLVEGQPALLVVVLNTFRYSRYLLVPERNAIHLVLHAEAQPRDMVQAYLQACILRKCLKTGQSLSPDNLPELRIILHDTLLAAENLTPPFMRALARQGWQTEKIVVEAHRRRARW